MRTHTALLDASSHLYKRVCPSVGPSPGFFCLDYRNSNSGRIYWSTLGLVIDMLRSVLCSGFGLVCCSTLFFNPLYTSLYAAVINCIAINDNIVAVVLGHGGRLTYRSLTFYLSIHRKPAAHSKPAAP